MVNTLVQSICNVLRESLPNKLGPFDFTTITVIFWLDPIWFAFKTTFPIVSIVSPEYERNIGTPPDSRSTVP